MTLLYCWARDAMETDWGKLAPMLGNMPAALCSTLYVLNMHLQILHNFEQGTPFICLGWRIKKYVSGSGQRWEWLECKEEEEMCSQPVPSKSECL